MRNESEGGGISFSAVSELRTGSSEGEGEDKRRDDNAPLALYQLRGDQRELQAQNGALQPPLGPGDERRCSFSFHQIERNRNSGAAAVKQNIKTSFFSRTSLPKGRANDGGFFLSFFFVSTPLRGGLG